MKEPEIGSRWTWNNPYQPIIRDVEVEVVENSDSSVTVKVLDESLLEDSAARARETYVDNGKDKDNVLEVCPLAKWDDERGTFVPKREHVILQTVNDRFDNQFEKA